MDGYCRFHVGRGKHTSSTSTTSQTVFSNSKKQATNNEIRDYCEKILKKFDSMEQFVARLQHENVELVNQCGELVAENASLKSDLADIKQYQNKLFFKNDAQNQYGRHEAFRVYNEDEVGPGQSEDCHQKVIDTVAKLGITMTRNDIHRCHRLGKPKTDGRPRGIICKTNFYPLKKSIMDEKKKLTPDLQNKSIQEKKEILKNAVFIAEDLSPFRGKIFRYVKDWNIKNKKYDAVSTAYGNIVCKIKDAEKNGSLLAQLMISSKLGYRMMKTSEVNFQKYGLNRFLFQFLCSIFL